MKNLYRICLTVLLTMVVGLGLCSQVFAASTVATNKKYKPQNVKIEYREFTAKDDDNKTTKMANVFVTWTNGTGSSDKVVELYFEGEKIHSTEVSSSLSSCEIRYAVLTCGEGSYVARVYPKRTGEGDSGIYAVTSKTFKISEKKCERLDAFDADLFVVEQPWLSYNKETCHLIAKWEEYPDVKKRMVCVKRGGTVVSAWKYANTRSIDISDTVAAKGTGTYTVGVYSTAAGEENAVYSDEFEVTSQTAKEIKQRVAAEQAAIEAGRIGWYNNGGVAWYYYKDYGVKAKNEWLDIEGKTYYFTSSGIMQTGWQVIDAAYYFFGTDGVLLRNTTTPDGYKVNGDGARVDNKGNVISAAGQKQLPANMTLLKSCTITVSETSDEAGVVKTATFKDGTGYTIKSTSFGTPYEEWKAGEPVSVTLVVEAKPNYYFDSSVKFSARGKSASSTGSATQRKVEFLYYPRMQLKEPTYLHVSGDGMLSWKKVDNAKLYKITLESDDYESAIKEDVEGTSFDLNGYLTDAPVGAKLKIYAVHSKNSKANTYFTNSKTVTIENINVFAKENTIQGTVTWNGDRPKYMDADGNPVSGWAKLFDNWYFFDAKGLAHAPGWLKHMDGNWYYFDSESRLCTGYITEDGKTYFLNDGSNKDLPLGAWVH